MDRILYLHLGISALKDLLLYQSDYSTLIKYAFDKMLWRIPDDAIKTYQIIQA